MPETIMTILGLIVGVFLSGAGIYYFVQNKNDRESKRVYSVITAIGLLILISMVVKIIVTGF